MEREQLQRILADDYLDGLASWSTAEVRAARAACEAEEEAVSYARRLVQGRLDILRDELERREVQDGEVNDVLSRLASVLAAGHAAGQAGPGRVTRLRLPTAAEEYVAAIDEVADEQFLADLRDQSLEELVRVIDDLGGLEVEFSQARRALFHRIDALRDDLARRYKDGSAAVGDLFGGA